MPENASTAEAQDDIVVTGRLQRGALAAQVPPEVSLNSTVIQSLGAADLTEVFRELSAEIGTLPAATNTPGNAAIVLVNGQRIAGFSSIKDLPPEAVSRIEIFPEQVALQYGYGPDQRVVNVVLREQYRALTLLGRYTLAPDTWRGVYRAKVDLVRIGETSHWNLALDYSHVDPIFAGTTRTASPAGSGQSPSVPAPTLAAQDDRLTASGAISRPIGAVLTELTGSLDLEGLQSRPGLSDQDGDLLAQEGLATLVSGPFARTDLTVRAQTSLTLNGKLDGWHWSVIGRLDDTARETRTDAVPGDHRTDAILLPSPGLLDVRCGEGRGADCVSTEMRRGSGDLYLNGDLFSLPAGAVTAALRTGIAFAELHSDSASRSTDLVRNEGSVQGALDLPLTQRDSAVGKFSAGINGEARRLSAFGALYTIGSTLDWSPTKTIDVLASFSRARQAPSLLQLGEATLDTPDLRKYDFVTGTTTIVQLVQGGNDALTPERSQIAKARLQLNPLPATDLAISAEYTLQRVRDPILIVTAATASNIAAFPTRFARQNGYLTGIDESPINGALRDTQQIRSGLTYSTGFGTPWAIKASAVADRRNQFQIALYDTWHLQDGLVLQNGQRRLNLLGGDIIGDGGGTPDHRIELQTSVTTRAVSADVSAVWQTPTTARAGLLSNQQLTFYQGITFNLRLQINLANQRWLARHLTWLRGNLNLSADNLLGAHTTVHDADGMVPLAYSKSYLNPTGRTFRITLRKRFR